MDMLTFYWKEVGILILVTACGVVVMWRVSRLREKALPIVLAVIFLVPILLNVLLIAFDRNATTYSALSQSPKKSLVARVVVWRGTALDLPYARVFVRSPHSLLGHIAYEGLWFSDEQGDETPYLKWKDNSHLTVRCPGDYYQPNECKSVPGVVIECRPQKDGR